MDLFAKYPTRTLTFDIESTSACDLAKCGAQVYWAHPTTRLICLSWCIDDGPIMTWMPGQPVPNELTNATQDYRVVAHNYFFEYWAWKYWMELKEGCRPIPFENWDCTMARALYWGLPAALIMLAEALGLAVQIDPGKKKRIMKMARPRSAKLSSTGVMVYEWWDLTDPGSLAELLVDCERDVEVERQADKILPPLPDFEQAVFRTDMMMNLRGMHVDRDLCMKLGLLMDAEMDRLGRRLSRLTNGEVTSVNQVAKILVVLDRLGYPQVSLAKGILADTIKELKKLLASQRALLRPIGQRLNILQAIAILELRQEGAKASTAKISALLLGSETDGYARNLIQYGGAGRTLRFAGRRAQPHNLPRGAMKYIRSFIAMVKQGATADELRAFLPVPLMAAISTALRGCFTAAKDPMLLTLNPCEPIVYVSQDLEQIEARVLPWLAGQQDILDVFASGQDVYTYTARKQGSTNRQFGKVLVLGLGFGMGWRKFIETALGYGIVLGDTEAMDAVYGWRDANPFIVKLWWDVDQVFKRVAQSAHGYSERIINNGVTLGFRKTGKAVRMVLPSGHHEIVYQDVNIDIDPMGREVISYMGVHPYTKKYARIRTYGARVVENATQATARDVLVSGMVSMELDYQSVLKIHGTPSFFQPLAPVLTVHDELLGICSVSKADAQLRTMHDHITHIKPWMTGLPLAASGWTGPAYRK